jgi:aspartate aminotransferase
MLRKASFTGLNVEESQRMIDEGHIYMTLNGRISMAGLNNRNVGYVAGQINSVVA